MVGVNPCFPVGWPGVLQFQVYLLHPYAGSLTLPHWSGVWPDLLAWSGLTSVCSQNIFTIPSGPLPAAHKSSFRPDLVSGWSGFTLSRFKSIFTLSSCLLAV